MMTTICLLILAYYILGKDTSALRQRLRNVDWHSKISGLVDKVRPWALKAGRVAARPILQFYYVLQDEKTSNLDRILIYAAIAYTILPMDFIPRSVFKVLGVLDDGVAVMYVYKKVKKNITPEINARVDRTLDEWFGVEYVMV